MDDGSAFLQIFLINLYGTRYLFLTGLSNRAAALGYDPSWSNWGD